MEYNLEKFYTFHASMGVREEKVSELFAPKTILSRSIVNLGFAIR